MHQKYQIQAGKKHELVETTETTKQMSGTRRGDGVVTMPEAEINLIKEKFIHRLSPKKIYLFGSYAIGTATEDSDFDFYIIVKDGTELPL